MVRYSFLLMILIGFSAISAAKADICTSAWWETTTVPNLEALAASLAANGESFPESCGWTTPLHLAVQFSPNKLVVEAFLSITRGANMNAFNDYEEIPLDIAEQRLEDANTLAKQAQETHAILTNSVFSDRSSRAISTSDRNDLIQKALEARRIKDQAESEQKVAEEIHEALSSQQ